MKNAVAVLGLLAIVFSFAACGSGVEADLEKSPEDLKKQAEAMSEAELEQAIEDLKALAEEWGEEVQAQGPEAMNESGAKEIMEKLGKITRALMIYGQELAKKQAE